MRIKRFALAVAVCGLCASITANAQEPVADVYQFHYHVAGYLLRAGNVCPGDAKRTIEAAFQAIGTFELKTLSQGYPKTTERWMQEGAYNFNTKLMSDGVSAACAEAIEMRTRIERP
jgi:hypothetical protein